MAPELFHSLEAADLRDLAAKVHAHQESEGLSDTKLLKLYADLGSTKTYGRILAGDLAELDLERQLTNYRAVWALIESGLSQKGRRDEALYDDLNGIAQFKRGFFAADKEQSIARWIMVEGDTGMGKTCIVKLMRAKYGTRLLVIEATVAWADSPASMLAEIITATGEKEVPVSTSERLAKVELLLKASRRCLVIEEAHHMGVRTLNLMKTLINKTPGEFVTLAYPTLWARLEKTAYHEARQLKGNRLAERIVLKVHASDVGKIVARRVPAARETLNGQFDAVVGLLVEKAPLYGNLALVREVCGRVAILAEGTDGPSYDQFVTAIDAEVNSR